MNIFNNTSNETRITEGIYYLCKCGEITLNTTAQTMQCPCCSNILYKCPACGKLNNIRRDGMY